MKRKSKAEQERDDAAYRNTMGRLDEHELGQMDWVTGQTEGAAPEPEPDMTLAGLEVPTLCPGCTKKMTLSSGWAVVGDKWLQCGACARRVLVTPEVALRLREAIIKHFHAHPPKPQPNARRRDRGAG